MTSYMAVPNTTSGSGWVSHALQGHLHTWYWLSSINGSLASTINSLWPSDTIWRHRSGSTLAQVMACCLMAPSHYLTQCWLIIRKFSDHQLRAISQEMPQPSITKVSLKITYISFHANLPEANELKISINCIFSVSRNHIFLLASMTLARVMAPSHHLDRYWFIINQVHWYSSQYIPQPSTTKFNLENYLSEFPFKSPRDQWIKITQDDWVKIFHS